MIILFLVLDTYLQHIVMINVYIVDDPKKLPFISVLQIPFMSKKVPCPNIRGILHYIL